MAGSAANVGLTTASPALGTVGRNPQTTATPAPTQGAPFTRQSRVSEVQGFVWTGAFGGLITQSLKAVGGYLRGLVLTINAAGGSGTTTSAVASADAPDNIIQSLILRDPLGQPIIQLDGFGLRMVDIYSGQWGMSGFQDPHVMPSYSAIATTGNFNERLFVPLELDSAAYCALPSLNASAQPNITIQLAAAATVYSTVPTPTTPTLTITCNELFWAAPIGAPDQGPPDVGSSSQWSETVSANAIPTSTYGRLTLPRVGTYIHTLILVSRVTSTGARYDAFPTSDLAVYVDGVPWMFYSESENQDYTYEKFGIAPITGVLPISYRDSVQQLVSSADTHDMLLPTTPATLLELVGTFQSGGPGTLYVYTGELFPVAGIPWTHLAQ